MKCPDCHFRGERVREFQNCKRCEGTGMVTWFVFVNLGHQEFVRRIKDLDTPVDETLRDFVLIALQQALPPENLEDDALLESMVVGVCIGLSVVGVDDV